MTSRPPPPLPRGRYGARFLDRADEVTRASSASKYIAVVENLHAGRRRRGFTVQNCAQLVLSDPAAACPVRENGQVPAADEPAVQMLATALIRLAEVGEWLDVHGALDRKGNLRSAARAERRMQSHALKLMSALGLTPAGRVRIGALLTATVDLATALSHPDPDTRADLMQRAGLPPPGGRC